MTEPQQPQHALRDAARLLRERAEVATHNGRGRWQVGKTLTSRSPVVVDDHDEPTVLIETWAPRLEDVNAHLAPIASPVVAHAISNLLDAIADDMDLDGAHLETRRHPDKAGSEITVVVHDNGSILNDWTAAYQLARTYLHDTPTDCECPHDRMPDGTLVRDGVTAAGCPVHDVKPEADGANVAIEET